MKSARHAIILEVIRRGTVQTQEEILSELNARGYRVTQATISRDINELGLIKVPAGEKGLYKYAAVDQTESRVNERLIRMFKESVLSIEYANNLIVLKTIGGSANAAASAIDSLKWPNLIGTIAGDDNILVIAKSNEAVQDIMSRFRNMMK